MSAPLPSAPVDIEIRVARDLVEIQASLMIRAVVFMGGQRCPYQEEIDGNDFAGSSHIIAWAGDEPAGSLRMRWFAGFAKFERAAVLPRFRGRRIAHNLMAFGIEHARRRGYRRGLGHSQMHMIDFYGEFGFRPRRGRPGFIFSDHEYVEIEIDMAPSNLAITPETPPMVLLRPEDDWDRPGVLEQSASRPATNPNEAIGMME